MIVITLPFSVLTSDNRHLITGRGGRRVLNPHYRASALAVKVLAAQQYKGPLLDGSIGVTTIIRFPDRRRRDLANYNKLVNDALTDVVWVDDSQIDQITNIRGPIDKLNPRLEIRITPEWRLV